MRIEWVIFFTVLLFSSGATADPDRDNLLRKAVSDAFPDVEITRIKPAPIPGLYEVMLGTDMVYLSEDGRYILQGDLIDLGKRINLSEQERAVARKKILESIPASETINFAPPDTRHTVYVFTDITCGYCQRFHRDVAELNSNGVAGQIPGLPARRYRCGILQGYGISLVCRGSKFGHNPG